MTRDPELRTTQSGISVCSFTVAVNRRRTQGQQPEADFFKVTAWRERGETCAKYLAKGKKVAVIGPVSVSTFQGNDGNTRAQLEVTAEDVEFLSPAGQVEETPQAAPAQQTASAPAGFTAVETDELPF